MEAAAQAFGSLAHTHNSEMLAGHDDEKDVRVYVKR
jgi:hypothetical protein